MRQSGSCGAANFDTARQLEELGLTPQGCERFNAVPDGGLVPEGGYSGGGGGSGAAQSVDPNALHAPTGFGPRNFVRADAQLPYRIEFENYGPGSVNEGGSPVAPDRWATAPAQRVVVTNTLGSSFDLNTFRFTGFGWGDFTIVLPAPSQSWQQIVPMSFNGRDFDAWFEAEIDFDARQLRMVFQSTDPRTELPPDVLTGFLPPEDGTGRGKGFITYSVTALAGVPSGTAIRNIALVQFDNAFFIATNQVDPLNPSLGTDPNKESLVTLDAGRPTSTVLPLPAETSATEFLVRWSGQDDAGGSGIASYAIFVSINNGPFARWLTNTTLTQAVYKGAVGKRRHRQRGLGTDFAQRRPREHQSRGCTADVHRHHQRRQRPALDGQLAHHLLHRAGLAGL